MKEKVLTAIKVCLIPSRRFKVQNKSLVSSHTDSTELFPDFLSRHMSPSFIAPARSSRLHHVSIQSWCKSLLVTQHRNVPVELSIKEHRLHFSSSEQCMLLILLGWLVRWEVGRRTGLIQNSTWHSWVVSI